MSNCPQQRQPSERASIGMGICHRNRCPSALFVICCFVIWNGRPLEQASISSFHYSLFCYSKWASIRMGACHQNRRPSALFVICCFVICPSEWASMGTRLSLWNGCPSVHQLFLLSVVLFFRTGGCPSAIFVICCFVIFVIVRNCCCCCHCEISISKSICEK